MNTKNIIGIILCCLPFFLIGQDQEEEVYLFRAGIVAGFNASQLDGDDFRGYDKMGANAGLKIKYFIPSNPKLNIGFEMLYSMKGSSQNLNFNVSSPQAKIKIDYVEIPIIVGYKEWNIDFHAGMSFGRLLRTSINEFTIYLPEDFKKNDFNILLGATYLINKNWGATLRFSRSVVNLVKKEINKDALLGHLLTFRVEYLF